MKTCMEQIKKVHQKGPKSEKKVRPRKGLNPGRLQ